jgi:SAM-dependent methyltransferase
MALTQHFRALAVNIFAPIALSIARRSGLDARHLKPAGLYMTDSRLFAPATQRNREPILALLRTVLPRTGLVVEIASGSGEHVVHFAAALPDLTFQPSDPSEEALASTGAWIAETGLPNIRQPLLLDAAAPAWPIEAADAIICINMIHIAPWAAAMGLMKQAGRLLPEGGPLYLYGPYRRPGRELEPSNLAFDQSLRTRNPEWGLRELDAVASLARENGFDDPEVTEMPANNLSLVFRRGSRG